MNNKTNEIGQQAAQSTTVFNPIVGAQFSELLHSAAYVAGQAVRHPRILGSHLRSFLNEAAGIIRGNSELVPDRGDRRFVDAAWSQNPLYRRSLQFWLAAKAGITECLDDIEMDKTARARALLLSDIVLDSLAPTNTLIGNPAALKQMFDTGGLSLLQGARNAYEDFISGNWLPAQVDSRNFEVGNNLASTEGAVVFRNDMLEVIQYAPLSKQVHEIPLLIIPPQINKNYVLDLTPDKSLVRYLLKQGFRVFCISWFNPGPAQEHWGLDDYVNAVIGASDVVMTITRQKKLNVMGACSGGITLSTTLSHLAVLGDNRINSCTLLVCVLDPRPEDTEVGALVTDTSIEFARSRSAKKGILSGKDLSTTFAWMRPNDLIWNYFVNNYLMGNNPPAFDILHWNNDVTNLPANLHSDFLDFFKNSPFAHAGEYSFMGKSLDLSRVKQDIFMVAGLTDHITPWKACYRSIDMFGGDVTFTLSNSGHIQALINPPGNPRSRYMSCNVRTRSAEEWLENAEQYQGTWWEMWSGWLTERSGLPRGAPRKLGNAKYPVLDKAPGLYVFG